MVRKGFREIHRGGGLGVTTKAKIFTGKREKVVCSIAVAYALIQN